MGNCEACESVDRKSGVTLAASTEHTFVPGDNFHELPSICP